MVLSVMRVSLCIMWFLYTWAVVSRSDTTLGFTSGCWPQPNSCNIPFSLLNHYQANGNGENCCTWAEDWEKCENEKELPWRKSKFILTLSVDYPMSKLILHWGYSSQPALTYYLQKLNREIFRICKYFQARSQDFKKGGYMDVWCVCIHV